MSSATRGLLHQSSRGLFQLLRNTVATSFPRLDSAAMCFRLCSNGQQRVGRRGTTWGIRDVWQSQTVPSLKMTPAFLLTVPFDPQTGAPNRGGLVVWPRVWMGQLTESE